MDAGIDAGSEMRNGNRSPDSRSFSDLSPYIANRMNTCALSTRRNIANG